MTSRSPTIPFQRTSTPATQPFAIVQSPGRWRSSVVWAYSASQRTSSSSAPRASAISNTVSEDAGALLGDGRKIWLIDGMTETHGYFSFGRVVDSGINGFQHGHLVHSVGEPRRHDGEELDETRVDTAAEDGRSAPLAGQGDAIASFAEKVAGDESGRAHHVDARTEDAD